MAGNTTQDGRGAAVRRVRGLITEAIDLLDAYGGPQQAAAHLALALDELREHAEMDDKNP